MPKTEAMRNPLVILADVWAAKERLALAKRRYAYEVEKWEKSIAELEADLQAFKTELRDANRLR